jgi:hypothetical protein
MRHRLFICSLFVTMLVAACAPGRGASAGFVHGRYAVEELHLPDEEKQDIVACPADPRNPLAAYLVTRRGEVYALIPNQARWTHALLARVTGDRARIACGDAWPGNGPIPELYLSAGRRLVLLAWRGGRWLFPLVLHEASSPVRVKAAVGDADPRWPGNEVYVSANQLVQLSWTRQTWRADTLPGAPGDIAVGDADRSVPGPELYVSGPGRTDQLWFGLGWVRRRIASVGTGAPQNAIVVGDADPTSPGLEVVLNWHATDVRGRVWLLARRPEGWRSELVFAVGEGTPWTLHHLHDLAIEDFDPAVPGGEILMAWSPVTHRPGRISLFARRGHRWEHQLLWQDLDEAHGMAILNLPPGMRRALVAVGHPRDGVLLRAR